MLTRLKDTVQPNDYNFFYQYDSSRNEAFSAFLKITLDERLYIVGMGVYDTNGMDPCGIAAYNPDEFAPKLKTGLYFDINYADFTAYYNAHTYDVYFDFIDKIVQVQSDYARDFEPLLMEYMD